jgi:hypothetical protein
MDLTKSGFMPSKKKKIDDHDDEKKKKKKQFFMKIEILENVLKVLRILAIS